MNKNYSLGQKCVLNKKVESYLHFDNYIINRNLNKYFFFYVPSSVICCSPKRSVYIGKKVNVVLFNKNVGNVKNEEYWRLTYLWKRYYCSRNIVKKRKNNPFDMDKNMEEIHVKEKIGDPRNIYLIKGDMRKYLKNCLICRNNDEVNESLRSQRCDDLKNNMNERNDGHIINHSKNSLFNNYIIDYNTHLSVNNICSNVNNVETLLLCGCGVEKKKKRYTFNNDFIENDGMLKKDMIIDDIISKEKYKNKIRLFCKVILLYLNNYLELSKHKLTLWVTLSSTFGYFMLGGSSIIDISSLLVGVYLCSSSANAFNQIIERNIDKLMKRTQKRPLANNNPNMSVKHAEIFAILTALNGSFILYFFNNPLTSFLGIFNIFLYTCIYTPLKRKTPYNTHIGSIVGSIPTLMGCTAMEQNLFVPEPWILFVTQFLWQFPHFYSLAYLYKDDYIKGKYKMFPLQDKNGLYTAKLCKPYLITLSSLPFILFFCGYTSYMYILTSILPNLFIFYKFQKIIQKPSRANIRSFFKHSLWHIMLLLALTTYHTQVPDKNKNNDTIPVNINSNEEHNKGIHVHKDSNTEYSITKFKKKLIKYCIVFS
ncbi:cytochrome c oxidase assembly protein (heme A: farnesyltransferase), putative [Plasmodium reichenowi]|uniref:Protoheme IX farnesyltransferase, mitochondrial n=1 Tax=Plasmodium reichenowi TaxID=5854 RepID=A0A060RU44_PLARE|nr:cytochrome c oxidase assembly protein (heme A: farnesyltransferase), putative [Plasmodium reichenowi]